MEKNIFKSIQIQININSKAARDGCLGKNPNFSWVHSSNTVKKVTKRVVPQFLSVTVGMLDWKPLSKIRRLTGIQNGMFPRNCLTMDSGTIETTRETIATIKIFLLSS